MNTVKKVVIGIINRLYLTKYNVTRKMYYLRHDIGCKIHKTEYYDELLKPRQYAHELKTYYYIIMRKKLNLKNPVTYTEKIQWFKLYGVTPHITRLCDKVAVRDWVKEKIGEQYLIPLLGVWDSFDEIDFSKLPEKFALKCNHGAGFNEIVYDKSSMNVKELKKKFDKWMSINYAFGGGLGITI